MMNAVFREWEFEIMEEYLYRQEHSPIDHFYKERFTPSLAWRSLYPHANFIIVYLEDFKKGTDGKYQLLMDFFTFSDYTRFIDEFDNEGRKGVSEENGILRTTFFKIKNYQSDETPIKGSHYYLDIRALRSLSPNIEKGGSEGFPLLYNITLQRNEENRAGGNTTLLYLTIPLTYPQWLFSSLQDTNNPAGITSGAPLELIVWDVAQGNFNEVRVGNKPYVMFDAGTEVVETAQSFPSYRKKVEDELRLSELPMFVLSHWHTDHYSLLFALNDQYLRRIRYFVFPAYVKNLSVFLFVARLRLLGKSVNMVTLPWTNPWIKKRINANLTLYANRYVTSNVNNSGLTMFVQGPVNNVMLPGDCRYKLAESQANDAITAAMGNGQKHFLVVPHHGGEAGAVSYRIVNANVVKGIVSVGKNNIYGHPNPDLMAKISPFLHGAIEMTKDRGDIMKGL